MSCMCPVHLLVRIGVWMEISITLTHKHPLLNSSGRRLAMMCSTLFLKKGEYENMLANCREWQVMY